MTTNDNNAIKPRGDIDMSMDPGMLLPHVETLKPGTPGNIVLESARQAMTTLYKETALMIDARNNAYKNQSPGDIAALQRLKHGLKPGNNMPPNAVMGPEGITMLLPNARQLNEAFDLSFKRAATTFDTLHKRAIETHETIVKSVAERIVDAEGTKPARIAAASETRALLRGMKSSERGNLIRTAIESGDIATAHAVLTTAPFLWGGDAKEQAAYRAFAEIKFAPDQTAQRDAVVRVLEKMRNASSSFVDKYAKVKVPERRNENDETLAALRKGA